MFTNKKSLLALSVASVFALSGCGSDNDGNEPDEPVTPPVVVVPPEAPSELALVVSADVVDITTQDVIAATVSFLENGSTATNIVDVDGNVLTTVNAEDGSVLFTKKADSTIEQVTVKVTAEGYIGKSFIVDLATDTDQEEILAQFDLTAKNAEGVSDVEVTSSVEGGTTSDEIIASTADGKSAASASIVAGVQLFDANDEPVSGEVTLNVTGADSSTSSAAAIVPAGINDADADSVVKPVGVANVTMVNADGDKVKSFSNDISVTMSIPASTMINGEAIETGDMLELSSHDEDTGQWTKETNMVTVGALNTESNTYTGTFETNHLTFFAATGDIAVCTAGVSIATSGDAVPPSGLGVNLASSDASTTGFIRASASNNTIISPGLTKIYAISSEATARVRVAGFNGQLWFDSVSEVPICGSVPVTLENPTTTVVEEDFTVTAACSDGTAVDMTNAVVRYSLGNKRKVPASGFGSGTFALTNLVGGETYNVAVNARIPLTTGGTSATTTITADGTAESIALIAQCEESTGGN
tara:strand:- start:523 stop:2115 length:1593 start_codon:yes stop_codon:yes gene_type:complete